VATSSYLLLANKNFMLKRALTTSQLAVQTAAKPANKIAVAVATKAQAVVAAVVAIAATAMAQIVVVTVQIVVVTVQIVVNAKCTPLPVHHVVALHKCHSYHVATNQSTAAIASKANNHHHARTAGKILGESILMLISKTAALTQERRFFCDPHNFKLVL
jgi:hypothetical protein